MLLVNCLTLILTVTTSGTEIALLVKTFTSRVFVVIFFPQQSRLIFFGVPPPKKPVEGGGSVKGEKRNS
jgi:hypothetical protein